MKITKYPQSCFLIESLGKKIIIDPGNLVMEKMPEFNINDWQNIDAVLITHKHSDHCDPILIKNIKKINVDVPIYGNSEVAEILQKENIIVNIVRESDRFNLGKLIVEVTPALHGYYFLMKGGGYPKENIGYIVDDGEHRLYHTSDTLMFEHDLQADIVLVPICGHAVVMEPLVAVEFVEDMKAKFTIPCHYDSPRHALGTEIFEKIAIERGLNYKILNNGEAIEL